MIRILKRSLLTVCIGVCFSNNFAYAQTKEIDSLKNEVRLNKRDSSVVTTLNLLSEKVLNAENIPGSLTYSTQAYELAKEIKFIRGKAYALKYMGMAEYYQGNFLKVLEYWTESIETFEHLQDTLGIANMTNNIGAVYYSKGSNAKAIDYYLRSLTISQKLNDPLRICTALLNIGGVYGQMNNYEKALEYYNQIPPYLQDLNDAQINSAYLMGIGEVYSKKKDYNNAILNYEKALPITKNGQEYAHNLTMLGNIEFKRGNNSKAIAYLNEALSTAKEKNLQIDLVNSLIGLGNIYQTNNFDLALKSYKEAEVYAQNMGVLVELQEIYDGLAKTYEAQGDFANAFKYQTLFISKKDALFNVETDDKIRGLQFDFDLEKKQDEIGLLQKEAEIQQFKVKRQKFTIYSTVATSFLILLLAFGTYRRYKYIKKTNLVIDEERNRAENLLLNILPDETAIELKKYGKVKAKKFNSVSVMFTDFKGFTNISANLSPEELVESVDYFFSKFDAIIDKYGLEKIKTIGDAYMCAGGLPFPTIDHHYKIVMAAFEILQIMEEAKNLEQGTISKFDIRIGINTGPVVAGVVGTKKFAYDIWGDTVNVAARMESSSISNQINIAENTYQLIKDKFDCSYRGEIDVKNKGVLKMYFVNKPIESTTKKSIPIQKMEV